MNFVRSIATAVSTLFVLPAQAATTDPEIILYRFSGVRDNGTMGTAFICTNFSGVTENIRVVVRSFDGTIKANSALSVPHLRTQAMTTRGIALYGAFDLVTGDVQGTAAIAATSPHIHAMPSCSRAPPRRRMRSRCAACGSIRYRQRRSKPKVPYPLVPAKAHPRI